MKPYLSCVIPFYNTADFLAECIESTLNQTFDDFELILVDNCSTDGSSAIASDYAARDPRIQIHKNDRFLTQIENYNHALSLISNHSTYCKIVQADDWLLPNCLSEMVELARIHPNIGVISSYRIVGTEVMPAKLPSLASLWTGKDAARAELRDDLSLFGTPTTVMFRSDIIRKKHLFFPVGITFPDMAAVFEVLKENDFGFVHQVLSFTRLDEESIYGRWQSFHPMALATLIQLKAYGAVFLTQDELDTTMRRLNTEYYRMLGREALRGRDAEFWDFHKKGLAEVNATISRRSVYLSATIVILKLLLSPIRVTEIIIKRLRNFSGV